MFQLILIKTAQKLLATYKNLETVYNNIENIKAKGTHKLIKDGAILTTCAADILNEYKGMYIDEEDISTFDEQEYNEEFLADDFIEKFEDLTPMEKEIARTMGKKENRTRRRKEAGKKEEASEKIRDRGFSGSTRYPKVSR